MLKKIIVDFKLGLKLLKIDFNPFLSSDTKDYMREFEILVSQYDGTIIWNISKGRIKSMDYIFEGHDRYISRRKFLNNVNRINKKYDSDFYYIEKDIEALLHDIETK